MTVSIFLSIHSPSILQNGTHITEGESYLKVFLKAKPGDPDQKHDPGYFTPNGGQKGKKVIYSESLRMHGKTLNSEIFKPVPTPYRSFITICKKT